MKRIQNLVQEIRRNFKLAHSKNEAHQNSIKLLEQVSHDPELITELFQQYLEGTEIYNRGHYPVVALDIASNADFTLSVNCWIPYQKFRTDIATKPIHHHGALLLSTTNIFGPGYQHLTFGAPKLINEEQELYTLDLVESKPHERHGVIFVDAWVPHLPLYPKDLTITLALWSHGSHTSWRDHLKHVPFIRRKERVMRELVSAIGLSKQLQLKTAHYYDFYPVAGGGFRGTPEKAEHIRGPHVDQLHSLFYILQKTGNARLSSVIRRRLKAGGVKGEGIINSLLHDLEHDRPIVAVVSDVHVDIPYLSFSNADILSSMQKQPILKGVPCGG